MVRGRGVREAVKKLARFMPLLFPEHGLAGRIAANIYAPPRATVDIDFLVKIDSGRLSWLAEYAVSKGYRLEPSEPGNRRYRLFVGGLRVDLLDPGKPLYDDMVISRRRRIPLTRSLGIMVLAPEDLVVLYLASSGNPGREGRDLESAYEVAYYSHVRRDFNWDYMVAKACSTSNSVCAKAILLRNRVVSEASASSHRVTGSRERGKQNPVEG